MYGKETTIGVTNIIYLLIGVVLTIWVSRTLQKVQSRACVIAEGTVRDYLQ